MRHIFLFFCVILFLCNHLNSQQLSVYFDLNSAQLRISDIKGVEGLLNQNPVKIHLNGFADSVGRKEYNKNLAQKRIDSVADFIRKHNVKCILSSSNYGEENSKYQIDSLNRRVDISYYSELFQNQTYSNDTQFYYIDHSHDTLLIGNEGTRIRIFKNTLVLADGKIPTTNKFEIRLLEYYKISDMLLGNITTSSDDQLLITGGMIYLEVYNNNQKCVLKNDKNMEIAFTNNTTKDSMLLFYGEKQNGQMNWKLSLKEIIINTRKFDEPSFVIVEENAQFMGGDINIFRTYIQSVLSVPFQLKHKGNDGKVIIQFAVNSNGFVENPKVLRGINKSIDSIAEATLMKSPRWIAGRQGGKPVKQQFVIPIVFDQNLKVDTINRFSDTSYVKKYVDSVNAIVFQVKDLDKLVFMSVDKLGWLNCDRFYNTPNLVNLNIKLKDEFELIYLVFKNMKSVIRYNYLTKVPNNSDVTIVSIRRVGADYSYAELNTKSSNNPIDLRYETISHDVLKTKLAKLNKK